MVNDFRLMMVVMFVMASVTTVVYRILEKIVMRYDGAEDIGYQQGMTSTMMSSRLFRGVVVVFMSLAAVHVVWEVPSGRIVKGMVLGVVNGCFLFAWATDCAMKKVYHFVWWIAGGCAGLVWLVTRCHSEEPHLTTHSLVMDNYMLGWVAELVGFLFFCILQQSVFARFYGRADCHAFCVSALLYGALNRRMESVWMHMILAFSLLIVVQVFRRNIARNGKLREPVAFVPYILIAFWLILWITQPK